MNNPAIQNAIVSLDHALLARARAAQAISKRTLVEELESLTGMEPRLVVRALALPFGLAVLETVEMLAFTPAFDLLPLSQAMAKKCVLLRASDGVIGGNGAARLHAEKSDHRPAVRLALPHE